MTSINCISDIHARGFLDPSTFSPKVVYDVDGYKYAFKPENLEPADYLVIAGDVAHNKDFIFCVEDIKEKSKGKFKDVICITGNHDYWTFFDNLQDNDSDYVEYDTGDIVFLGCTLWTPVYNWKPNGRYGMCDYKYINNFSIDDSNNMYAEMSSWLRKKLEQYKDRKVVVITHHCPFKELVDEEYQKPGMDNLNPFFCVMDGSLDDINEHNNIKLWICGHSHSYYDGILHGVHVVRNPIGYRSLYDYLNKPEVSTEHWYNKIVTV